MTTESTSEREEQEIQEAIAALLGGRAISGEQDISRDFEVLLDEDFLDLTLNTSENTNSSKRKKNHDR